MTLTRGPTAPSSTAVRTSSAATAAGGIGARRAEPSGHGARVAEALDRPTLRLLLAGGHRPQLPALRSEVPTRDGILGDTVDR